MFKKLISYGVVLGAFVGLVALTPAQNTDPSASAITGITTAAASMTFDVSAPVTNTSFFDYTGTVPIVAAGETTNYMDLSITSTANHTGGNLNGLNIGGITADAQATEIALWIADGWDQEIYFAGATGVIDGATTVSYGAGTTVNLMVGTASIVRVNAGTAVQSNKVDINTTLHKDTDYLELVPNNVTAMAATDISNALNIIGLDTNSPDHTGGNLNAINIGGITQDADATETALWIAAGWDAAIQIDDGTVTDDAICLGAGGCATDAAIYFDGAGLEFDVDSTGNDYTFFIQAVSDAYWLIDSSGGAGEIRFIPVNATNSGANIFEIEQTAVNNTDGNGDTINIFTIDFNDTAWAAAGTDVLNGINVAGITQDADATNNAINIGDGWDYSIVIPDGGSTDNSIAFGDTQDAEIYFDGTDLWLNGDVVGSHGINLRVDVLQQIVFDDGGGFTDLIYDPQNVSNTGVNLLELQVTAVLATNGSDIVNMLELDWNETDWATDSETLNGINIDTITQDAQGTYNAINIGDSWDRAIAILVDGSSTSNTIEMGVGSDLVMWSTGTSGVVSSPNGTMVLAGPAEGDINLREGAAGSTMYTMSGGAGDRHQFGHEVGINVGFDFVEMIGTFAAVNGSDTSTALSIELTNTDHTGITNVIYGINLSGITGDAQARETGIDIGSGWDVGISSADHIFQRENFKQGFRKQLASDFSAATDTDGSVNIVLGTNGVNFEYREEQDKTTSSFILNNAGAIDISADNTIDNEGVEIMLGSSQTTTSGYLVAQTDQLCFSVNAKVTLIAGTDQFVIGWRANQAYEAANVYTNYSDYNVVGINNVDGSVFGLSDSTTGGAETDDSGTNWADGETKTLKACIDGAGLPHGYLDGTVITETNRTTAMDAGINMVPFISYLQAGGAADAAILINWWEITAN